MRSPGLMFRLCDARFGSKTCHLFGYGPDLRFSHHCFRNRIAQSSEPASSGGLDDVQDGPVTSSVVG